MNFSFVGKSTVVSDALKQKAEEKLLKLERLLPDNVNVNVTFRVEKSTNIVEVTVPIKKRILRAEVKDDDMYAAIDKVVDLLERQMRKHKTRLSAKSRKDKSFSIELEETFPEINESGEEPMDIKRVKKVLVKPMDVEEAIMEMELAGHVFFVFKNSENDSVNVVYKRDEEGSYGLIEAEEV